MVNKMLENKKVLFLRDVYPDIDLIIIKYRMKSGSFDGTEEKDYHVLKIHPDFRYDFTIRCINRDCKDGGFDLFGVILSAIISKNDKITGSATCEGWEDEERIKKHRCMSDLFYEVSILYHQDACQDK